MPASACRRRRLQPNLGKFIVTGGKDRATGRVHAEVTDYADATAARDYIEGLMTEDAFLYTDESPIYNGIRRNHRTIMHKAGEYVADEVHTQGIESFWGILKRAHKGTYHYLSGKHLQRYLDAFCWRHNVRHLGTLDQMRDVIRGMAGKMLPWRELTA